jgi:GTPase SAR1 family protein
MFISFFIGALIVYDITDQDSFTKVGQWVKELRKYLPGETPIIIAGNKCDMQNR